jgi:DNA-binding response OmpR family regulator
VYIEKLKEWLAGQAGGTNAAAAANIPPEAADSPALDKVFGALIMMVDDEPLVLEVTQVQLEDAGFSRFITTSNAIDALALIAERRPDILLLDLMMPGMSGFDILGRMEASKILKEVPTIVLTSATDGATRLKALELGVTEFLIKPVDPLELVLRVSNTLAAKAYWQGCWAAQ